MASVLTFVFSVLQQATNIVVSFISKPFLTVSNAQDLASMPMKHIVILGGSYAGVGTTHRILKQANKTGPFKITLVAPNTHLYWNMASPRGIIPGQLDDEKLFRPLLDGFQKYDKSHFEFVLGTATALDIENQHVSITSSSVDSVLEYDILILATGSHTREPLPFKNLDTTEATRSALHDFQQRIAGAKSIVVGGAGVTGCEVAGELGYQYGREKKITLLSSAATVLDTAPPAISAYVTKALRTVNVDIRPSTKVTSTSTLPSTDPTHPTTLLHLSTGASLAADMYIPAHGLVPNTAFLPPALLDAHGFVMVNEFLRAKGAGASGLKGKGEGSGAIYALGDVCDVENAQFVTCDRQSAYLAKSIVAVLRGKVPRPYKEMSRRFMGLQIGRELGTGHLGNFRMPSFVIVRARRNLFVENAGRVVDGSWY